MKVKLIGLDHRLAQVNLAAGDSSPIIAGIQKNLAGRGLYAGDCHGILDNPTREAVSFFQESEGIRVTGQIDPLTFCRLQQSPFTELSPETVRQRVSRALSRANILLIKSQRRLTVFDGNTPVRQFPVAIGKPATPTPVGNFAIASKVVNPGGVLGTRWMGLNYDSYGIHGTNKPWLIGQMVSNGCIRMHNAHAEDMFILVNYGTPVLIRD